MEAEDTATEPAPKRRGRPPGVRNKPHLHRPELDAMTPQRLTPPSTEIKGDYRHADPETIIARQLSMLDWAQQACRNEMQRAMQAGGVRISTDDIKKLESLSNAIVRSIDALKKSADLADELSQRLTPEQLMEAALKKIEGQDTATLKYAIKRLRAYLEKITPVGPKDKRDMGEYHSAADTIAALEDE